MSLWPFSVTVQNQRRFYITKCQTQLRWSAAYGVDSFCAVTTCNSPLVISTSLPSKFLNIQINLNYFPTNCHAVPVS